jgi:hypothetical protein
MCIHQKFAPGKDGFTNDFKGEALAMISSKLLGFTVVLKRLL